MNTNRTEYKGKIIGMVLGDGYLSGNRKNSYLKIKHSIKQEDYFTHKVSVVEQLTSVNIRKERAVLNSKEYFCLVCETKSHPLYTSLRDRFYHRGRKTVDEFLMKTISDEGLAYWYLDDGCWGGGPVHQDARICTDCFNKVEQDLMCYWLAKRFDLHFKAIKYRNTFRLKLPLKDVNRLVEIIEPFTPDSMKYKLNFHELKPNAKKHICQFCQKDFYPNRTGDSRGERKHCSTSCSQKALYSMGRGNLYKARMSRRYDLNSEVTQRA